MSGFKIHTIDGGRAPGIEYLPCGAITPKVGQALVMTNGNLAIAGGTTKPTYISMCERETACASGEIIPVFRVLPDTIFESTFSAAATSVKLGSKVTLSADGLQTTGTTEGGIAEVVDLGGTAAGDMVRVRFE